MSAPTLGLPPVPGWALGLGALLASGCHGPERLASPFPPEQVAASPVDYLEADQGRGRSIRVRVDPRIELFCILAQLAEFDEFVAPLDTPYARAVLEHFGPFRDHPAIKRLRSLRRWRDLSHDGVLSLAVHVTDPPALAERAPLEPRPDSLDPRWTPSNARTFLEDARDFASVSDFFGFWRDQRATLAAAEERLARRIEPEPVLAWLDGFFGGDPGLRFHAVPGMLAGSYHYGVRCTTDGPTFVYQIMGVDAADGDGLALFPTEDPRALGTLVHEYAHAFVDPLVARSQDALRPAGKTLFQRMEPEMRAQSYASWSELIEESLVRAATLRFFHAHRPPEQAARETERQYARGFLWVESLAQLLAEYQRERDLYRTLDAFMPRLQAFFAREAASIDQTLEEWDARLSYWRSVDPVVSGALRREVMAQLNEVHRILDHTAFDLELMRRSLASLETEHDLQVTILDASGDFLFHAADLTGSAYHHRDVRGRSIYREWNEGTARSGVAFNIDAVSGDRRSARAAVVAYERYEETGWLVCVEGYEWQSRSDAARP